MATKKLDEVNFEDSLNEYSNEDIQKMFKILSRKMQDQVIGFTKVGDEWEAAITTTMTMKPLSLFGVSEMYHGEDVFPTVLFPEGKTLSQLAPLELHGFRENLKGQPSKEMFTHKDLEFDRERVEKMGINVLVYAGFKSAPINKFSLHVGDMTYYYETEGGRDADFRLLQKLKPNFKYRTKN